MLPLFAAGCGEGDEVDPAPTVAGHGVATQAALRSIPVKYVAAARAGLHVAYQHTSHGTHVSYGLFGLPGFKAGDETLFAITNGAAVPEAGKLDFHDYAIGSPVDLSNGVDSLDANGDPSFVVATRAYLDMAGNASINVVMWSWCSIGGHTIANYLNGMQSLIDEYGPGGSKIGSGSGQRAVPVTFVFMTGHAEAGANVGDGRPKNQAQLIVDYCAARGYYCLDYYSIDTHAMDGTYYEDAGDDSDSEAYTSAYDLANGTSSVSARRFYVDWQGAHTLGNDWYYDLGAPGGSATYGEHNTQYVTANRKAYAMWYILARIAGWDGVSSD